MSDATAMIEQVTHRMFGDYATAAGLDDGTELPSDLWAQITQAGLPLALVPESAGGSGLAFSEVMPLFRAIGQFAIAAPLAETMLAASLLAQAGIAIPGGILSIAPVREGEKIRLEQDGGWRCSGTITRVPWADQAAAIVVVAEHEGASYAALIDPARTHRSAGANVAGQARDTLTVDETLGDAMVGRLPGPPRLIELGAAVRIAEISGVLDELVELTARYTADRVQFGRPIAKFQAVQHLVAQLAGHAAVTLAAADLAAETIDRAGDRLDIAVAKAAAAAAAGEGAAIAHQVFGAIGITREHRLHRSTLRLLSWRDEFGSESWWQTEIGQAAIATGGGERLWTRMTQ